MAADIAEIFVTRLFHSQVRCPFHDIPNTTLTEVHQRFAAADIFRILVSVDIALDILWKVSIARLPTVPGGVLPLGNTQPIVFAVLTSFHVF